MKEPIPLSDFFYNLPQDRIAQHPLEERAQSKLLVYQKGKLQHKHFYDIKNHIPSDSLLILNNTKVIPARIFFKKDTGAVIEIFLLQPEAPTKVVAQIMSIAESCTWQCMIGKKKRWKTDLLQYLEIDGQKITITASLTDAKKNLVTFSWDSSHSFAEVVKHLGALPLPPYIKRELEQIDEQRYQTVYSKQEGAVAAPTAGLHFTPDILEALEEKSITIDHVTLHVSAGTFQPVTTPNNILEHKMHSEQVVLTKTNIQNLLQYNTKKTIAVGTTSMRTLESLYWYGVMLLKNSQADFYIQKLYPYEHDEQHLPTRKEALEAIISMMDKEGIDILMGETAILIYPGYTFRICGGLITNFHMPETTLMLLVASFVGEDWAKIYQSALDYEYRFLSYGDSSLLLP